MMVVNSRIVLLLTLISQCSSMVLKSQEVSTKHVSSSVRSISNNVLKSLADSSEEDENIIISPVSLYFALSMLYHAAEDITKNELNEFLEFDNFHEDQIEETSKQLLVNYAKLRSQLNTTIQLANAIFVDDQFDVHTEYSERMQESLLSTIQTVDFLQPSESAEVINNWVENKTDNLISDFLSPDTIHVDTRMMLLNAIYFKADWKNKFEESETFETLFNINSNTTIPVSMMTQTNSFLFAERKSLDASIVSLPYEDETFSMILFLPNTPGSDSLDELLEKMTDEDYNALMGSLSDHELMLSVPSFKVGYKTELRQTLEKLGLESVFGNADFTGLSDEPVQVDNVIHETKLEVSEAGSEAAGVTGALLGTRSGVVSRPRAIIFDRPFLFVIHDQKNNIPLFIGRITTPNNNNNNNSSSVNIESRRADVADEEEVSEDFRVMDPEDKAYYSNSPDIVSIKNCTITDFINSTRVMFPCPPYDTEPIEDYKKVYGDNSEIGVNGEMAALRNV